MSQTPKSSPTKATVLLKRIADTFPDVHWSSYEYIDEGWDHEVIILDHALVFRFPDDNEYLARLKNELVVIKQLKPLLSVAIPEYSHIAPDRSFAGYPLIPGIRLTAEALAALSSEEKTALAKQLAEFLSTIHQVIQNGHDFSSVELSDLPEEQKEIKELVNRYLPTVLDASEMVLVNDILAEVDEIIAQPTAVVFLHGDMYTNHLLWDESRKHLGIIDFSDMNRGDPAVDFAELYEYGKEFVEEVCRYYTGPKDDTFLDRAWVYQKWMAVYMLTDHFVYHKTSFEVARKTFDRIKRGAGS